MATKKPAAKLADITNTPKGFVTVRGLNVALQSFTRGEHQLYVGLGDGAELNEKLDLHELLKAGGDTELRAAEHVAVQKRYMRVRADLLALEPKVNLTLPEFDPKDDNKVMSDPDDTLTSAEWECYNVLCAEKDDLERTLLEIRSEQAEATAELKRRQAEAANAAWSALEDVQLKMLWRVLVTRHGYGGAQAEFLETATPDEMDAAEAVCSAGNAMWGERMRERLGAAQTPETSTAGTPATPNGSSGPDSPLNN